MGRVELAVVVISLTILGSLLVPAIDRAHRNSRVTRCCGHLAQLWKMEYNYQARFGRMPDETGSAFWLRLSKPPAVLVDSTIAEIYQCPVEGVGDPGTDYRGPAIDVDLLGDGDPVGGDVPGNHPDEGGNVIRKSGDVQTVGERDPLWRLTLATTSGGSPPGPARPPRTIVWVLLGAAALLVIVRFFAPRAVAPRSWAFLTALFGLLGLAGYAYLC